MRSSRARIAAIAASVALIAAACGGGSDATTDEADSVDDFVIQGDETLDPDATTTTTEAPAEGGGGASETDDGDDDGATFDATTDTIPTDGEEDEFGVGGLFAALGSFTSCLEVEGYAFIGRPNPELEATDPVNDSGYGEALGTCAATSNIGQAFSDFQSASDNLSTGQIETRNRTLVFWVDCMEGRGWEVGEPSTDTNGLQQPNNLTPPEGESIFGSDDLAECSVVAQQEYEASGEGDS